MICRESIDFASTLFAFTNGGNFQQEAISNKKQFSTRSDFQQEAIFKKKQFSARDRRGSSQKQYQFTFPTIVIKGFRSVSP